jgi:hydrogenase/urease accessory protein HupE
VTRAGAAVLLGVLAALLSGTWQPVAAHDATTTAYAEVTGSGTDVEVVLELEYDLLMKSAWLYAEAYEATARAEQLRQLETNADAVTGYVVDRFQVAYDNRLCAALPSAPAEVRDRDSRAFAVLALAYDCENAGSGSHTIYSALFPDEESYVHSTGTLVRYDVDGVRGSTVLDAGRPQESFGAGPDAGRSAATGASVTPRERSLAGQAWEFFVLGGEHLLLGLDHLLFVLALVVGASGLRDVVLAASTFTAAHSVTLVLAALGVVGVPAGVVEPLIALSITAVAVLHLALRRRVGESAGRLWLPVVFGFGLLHGLGFAGALGIEERWSWDLLWALLAFNVGIEVAQVALMALVFPPLILLRRTPLGERASVAGGVTIAAVGLMWFFQRLPLPADLAALTTGLGA